MAWCLRGELLFLLFPLATKAAVILVNLKIKETETTRKIILKCDISTLYVLIRLSPAATRHQNNCQVSHKLSVTYLFTNIRGLCHAVEVTSWHAKFYKKKKNETAIITTIFEFKHSWLSKDFPEMLVVSLTIKSPLRERSLSNLFSLPYYKAFGKRKHWKSYVC